MTDLTQKYAGSIAAGMALEGGVWALALALAKDVQANGGTAREAMEALAEAGVTSSSGEPYKLPWISHLVQTGTFVLGNEGDWHNYPLKRVSAAGMKHDWDVEAMLLTLQANGTSHQISGSSAFGKPDRDALLTEADRLSADDRAALATALVSQGEVREAILRSTPMAREQHIELTTDLVRASVDRSERRARELNPGVAASDAADEIANAANHLNNALAEIIMWKVTLEHDRLRRVESAMQRVERATNEINEALERVTT